jgi:hypothetical protein
VFILDEQTRELIQKHKNIVELCKEPQKMNDIAYTLRISSIKMVKITRILMKAGILDLQGIRYTSSQMALDALKEI